MEEKKSPAQNVGNLHKCPHCACCFCSEADLNRHMQSYGNSRAEHVEEFRRVHGRLEHGSFGGPE